MKSYTRFRLVPLLMTLKYIWRSFQPMMSFPRPFQQSLACFRVARSPSNSWASCWFRPPNAKNLLPSIFGNKSPISRLVWQIDRRCLHLPGGLGVFGDGRFNGTTQNVLWPTLVAMATKFGLKSPITRLVWHIDRRCLHLPRGFQGWPIQWNHAKCFGADPCCHGNDILATCADLVAYRFVFVIRLSKQQEIYISEGWSCFCPVYSVLLLCIGFNTDVDVGSLVQRTWLRWISSTVSYVRRWTITSVTWATCDSSLLASSLVPLNYDGQSSPLNSFLSVLTLCSYLINTSFLTSFIVISLFSIWNKSNVHELIVPGPVAMCAHGFL